MNRLRTPETQAPCVGRRICGAAQKGRGGSAAEKRMGGWEAPLLGKKKRALWAQRKVWAALRQNSGRLCRDGIGRSAPGSAVLCPLG